MKNMFLIKYVVVVFLSIAVPVVGMEISVPVHLMKKQISGVSVPVRQPDMTDVTIFFELVKDQKTKMVSAEDAKKACPHFESSETTQHRMIPFNVMYQASSSDEADYQCSVGGTSSAWIPYPWILNDERDAAFIFKNELENLNQVKIVSPYPEKVMVSRLEKVTLRNLAAGKIDAEHADTLRNVIEAALTQKGKIISLHGDMLKNNRREYNNIVFYRNLFGAGFLICFAGLIGYVLKTHYRFAQLKSPI